MYRNYISQYKGDTQKSFEVGVCASQQGKNIELVGVQVIFRHGARTPVYTVTMDKSVVPEAIWDEDMTSDVAETVIPYLLCDLDGNAVAAPEANKANVLPGGAIKGQLTRQGQEQMFAVGRRLRDRYITEVRLMPVEFGPQHVYCRSTRYPRTIASARCVLAGLYGDATVAEGPIRIHVNRGDEEEVLTPNRNAVARTQGAMQFTPTDFPPGIMALRETVAQAVGPDALIYKKKKDDGSVKEIASHLHCVRDDLVCRMHHGYPLPDEVRALIGNLDRLCPYEMAQSFLGSEELWHESIKAASGPMFQLISDNLSNQAAPESRKSPVGDSSHSAARVNCRSSDLSSQKMFLYSSHDDMLITLLVGLGLFDDQWPRFGADLIIELYSTKDRGHIVQVLYCDKLIARIPLEEFQQQLGLLASTA